MQRWLFIILTILAVIVGLTVGLLNAEPVNLDILLTELTTSVGMVVVGSFASGLLLGTLALWAFRLLPLSIKFKRLQREYQHSQDQLNDADSANLSITASLPANEK